MNVFSKIYKKLIDVGKNLLFFKNKEKTFLVSINISKTHQRYSEYLNNPRVLTNPEEFLGPNYKEVLNFWLILDDLSEEQLRVIEDRHDAFINENHSKWSKATDLAWEASVVVVGFNYSNDEGDAALVVTNSYTAYWATRELIGMHLILEQNKPLTFFEMILEVL